MFRHHKTVTDPVHGNIGLTEVEARIMATPAMQRLHNVRQLGLAHLVYPGANYSRFAHSVGACHNAGCLIDAIERNDKPLSQEEAQEYRLVALLHDVGHYPFSHATETVIKNYYSNSLFTRAVVQPAVVPALDEAPVKAVASDAPPFYNHEKLGEFIIRNDEEIGRVLKDYNISSADIADRFSKAKPDPLISIISSDLDCDRLDYLKRTALNSGAPFGSVDIGFLMEQATRDETGVFCFKLKAARAADHLLVSRFYDYMQVPYNKTVVALEWSLSKCLHELLRRNCLDCSGHEMENRIQSGVWKYFDDQCVVHLFRELVSSSGVDELVRDHALAILERKTAKLIAGWDEIVGFDEMENITRAKYALESKCKDICRSLGIHEDRFFTWQVPVKFMKFNANSSGYDEEKLAEAVQILNSSGRAGLLVNRKDTLIHRLCSYQMAGLRVYYLPDGKELTSADRKYVVSEFEKIMGASGIN